MSASNLFLEKTIAERLQTLNNQFNEYIALQATNEVVLAEKLGELHAASKNAIDHKTYETWEEAINHIDEIAKARIDYNVKLAQFATTATSDDLIALVSSLLNLDKEKIKKSTSDDRKRLIEGAKADARLHVKIRQLISQKPHNQKLIDELHYYFHAHYETRKNSEKVFSNFLNQINGPDYLESYISKKCSDFLSPFISSIQKDLLKDTDFIAEKIPYGNIFVIIYLNLTEREIIPFLEKIDELIAHYSSMEPTIREAISELADVLNDMKEGSLTEENFFSSYHRLHPIYHQAKEAIARIEQELLTNAPKTEFSLAKEQQKPKSTKENKRKKNKNTSSNNDSKSLIDEEGVKDTTVQTIQSSEPLKAKLETTAFKNTSDDFAERTKAYKEKIMRERQEKEALIASKKEQEKQYLEQQKVLKNQSQASESEQQYKEAFHLLNPLNTGNLELIELIFQKPTPHHQIRYQDIENLFGLASDGKLPGRISAVNGTSHRQISIHKTIGFFDTPYNPQHGSDSSSTSVRIVGGTFKPHGNAHTGKLPSFAIELVRGTLERAGITIENLKRFHLENSNNQKDVILK